MAYLPPQNTTAAEDQTGQQPQMSGGESTVSAGQGSQPASTPAKTSSGSWTNLNKYLTANQGFTSNLGTGVAGQISGAGDTARSAISGASDVFNKLATSATPTIDQTLLQKAWTDPTQVDPNAFNAQRYAQYTGPNTLADTGNAELSQAYGNAVGAAQKAKQTGELLNTEGGRQTLVGNLYGPGQFRGAGLTSLDAMLLQNDPNALAQAQQAQAGLGDIQGLFTGAETGAAAKAEAGQQAAADTRQNFQRTFFDPTSGYIPTFGNELNQRAQNAITAALGNQTTDAAALQHLAQMYQASPTEITPGGGLPSVGVSVGSGLQAGSSALPSWASDMGLNQEQYNQLLSALQNYSTFDYAGVNPMYAQGGYKTSGFTVSPTINLSYQNTPGSIAVTPGASTVGGYLNAPALNLNQYLQQLSPDELAAQITQQSVQTPEEAARLNALNALMGGGAINYAANPDVAGTAPASGSTLDVAGLMNYINQADQAANQQAYQNMITMNSSPLISYLLSAPMLQKLGASS